METSLLNGGPYWVPAQYQETAWTPILFGQWYWYQQVPYSSDYAWKTHEDTVWPCYGPQHSRFFCLLLHQDEPFACYFHATQQENHGLLFYAVRKRAEENQRASANVHSWEMWLVKQQSHQKQHYFTEILTARFLRPFALLRLITRRPFLVAILTRKPWVRLREILLGWYVLFILIYLYKSIFQEMSY